MLVTKLVTAPRGFIEPNCSTLHTMAHCAVGYEGKGPREHKMGKNKEAQRRDIISLFCYLVVFYFSASGMSS